MCPHPSITIALSAGHTPLFLTLSFSFASGPFYFIWTFFLPTNPPTPLPSSPHSLLPIACPAHRGPLGYVPQAQSPAPWPGPGDSAVVAPLPPRPGSLGVQQGLGTSLQAWVEVALPDQGNVGWLLEGDRGEILLPVEEK